MTELSGNQSFNPASQLDDNLQSDQSGSSSEASNTPKVDSKAITLRVTQNPRLDREQGWMMLELALANYEGYFSSIARSKEKATVQVTSRG